MSLKIYISNEISALVLCVAEKKEAASVKGHLWKLLSVKRLNSKANKSSWLESYKQHLVELGVDEDMQSRAMLLQLWATQVKPYQPFPGDNRMERKLGMVQGSLRTNSYNTDSTREVVRPLENTK